jgi:hypothetical protein
MARGILPVLTTGRNPASCAVTWTSADGTNKHVFDNTTPNLFLLMKNTGASPFSVVIKRPVMIDGTAIGDVTVVVPATTGEVMFGPFPVNLYNQADAGTSLTNGVLIDPPASCSGLSFALIKMGGL